LCGRYELLIAREGRRKKRGPRGRRKGKIKTARGAEKGGPEEISNAVRESCCHTSTDMWGREQVTQAGREQLRKGGPGMSAEGGNKGVILLLLPKSPLRERGEKYARERKRRTTRGREDERGDHNGTCIGWSRRWRKGERG